MRPFVTEIASNVKQPDGKPRKTELGKHTLLLGPNRSGKSAIIQGLELATTGAVDDVMGREGVKLDKTLLSLVPEGSILEAKATFTTGKASTYHKGEGKAVSNQDVICVAAHRMARKALSGSSVKLEEAILEWTSLKNVSRNDIVDLLPSKVHAKYLDIADRMSRRALNEGEVLTMIADYAAKEQRKLSSQIKAQSSLMDAMSDRCKNTYGDVEGSDIIDVVMKEVKPLSHLQKAATWAAESGVDQCPTCGSQVGNTHIKACADHLNSQEAESADLKAMVDTIHGILHDHIMWGYVVKYKREIEALSKRQDDYKALKNHCLGAISMLVKTWVGDFCDEVNRYLPDTWALKYSEAHQTLGLSFDGGAVLTSLSGTEWVTLVTAVSCAVADKYPESVAALLVVEDRAWDSETLASVMRGLSKFDGQVIIQSTVKPKGRTPKGWTVIETERKTASPKEISPLSKTMLTSLGYSDEDIDTMSMKTLEEILEQALVRSALILKADGGWEFM